MFPFWFGLLFSCDSEKSATQQNDADNQVVANDPATQDSASDEAVDSSEPDDSASTNTETEDDSGEPVGSCDDQLEPALTWFDNENIAPLSAELSFAQTHVINQQETRWAPKLATHRAMTVLITPASPVDSAQDVRLSAWQDGQLLGVIPVLSPEKQPALLEQSLTSQSLAPWSTSAWSAVVPYSWVASGVELKIAYEVEDTLYQRDVLLENLASPHVFTLSRAKIVLFGESSFDTTTEDASMLSQDFFATLPFAELRFVDSNPWVVDQLVVDGANGPVLVSSEGERLALTTDPDRWSILKLIFTHRMSLANFGQGLSNTEFWGGNSPYSFGTSLGLGWVRNDDGSYSDINNAPYSAGWTGWSSIWHGECGNVFNHEIGHSFTLEHFTPGSASAWGIADEYPDDGVSLASHPWGFDTTRNMFRTWYRVDAAGIVTKEDGTVQGKHDCMNGGEAANAVTCFPQYTAYHAWKIQDWSSRTPTFLDHNGQKGLFSWNAETAAYEPFEATALQADLSDVGVPTVTLIGSLGANEDTNIIYPGMYWPEANQFALPDPQDPSLVGTFDDANYYLAITYADGSVERALINRQTLSGSEFSLFSVNVDLRKEPQTVSLFHSPTGYPNIDYASASSLYTRTLSIPTSFAPVITTGQGAVANGPLTISERCEANINCEQRRQESLWRTSNEEVYFTVENEAVTECAAQDSFSSFTIPVQNTDGSTDVATVYAQRVVRTQSKSWHTSLNDATAWTAQPNREQGLRVWLPYAENQHLGQGVWKGEGQLTKWEGGLASEVSVKIETEVFATELVDMASPFESGSLLAPGSSLYFILTDPSVGPTTAVWWGSADPTLLTIPVVDQTTGEAQSMYVNAWKKACELGWGTMWSLNSGQVADTTCTYQVYLELPSSGNEHLLSGHTYLSPVSQPIVFEGRYWHYPANELAGRFVYQFQYTVP